MKLLGLFLVGVVVCLGSGAGVLALMRRFGKDAVAGREPIAWPVLKHARW